MPCCCRNILTVSLACLAAVGAARAQEAGPGSQTEADPRAGEQAPSQPAEPAEGAPARGPEQPPAGRDISLDVELFTWYTGPGGRLWLPGGGRDIDVEDLNIDSPRLSPAGRLRLEVDEWSFTLSAAHYSIDQRTTSPVSRRIGDVDITEGDALRTQMDFTTAELIVGNTFFQRNLYAFDYPQSRLGVELEAGLGARLDHFNVRLQREAGGEASGDEFFLMPLAAVEARVHPTPRTTLAFAATAGWNPGLNDQEVVTSDIIVRAGWEVTSRVELMAGYRISIQRMRSGDDQERFELNGSMAGLYGGVRIGF